MKHQGSPLRETVRNAYKDFTLKKLYPGRYRAACKAPVVPGRVVFLEIREKTLSDNFRVIRAALEKLNHSQDTESGSAHGDSADTRRENGSAHGDSADVRRESESRRGNDGKATWTMELVCIGEGLESHTVVMKNCLGAIPRLARAQYIFVNESSYFLSSLPIRPETTVIQTWHACGAFKKFGYSVVGKGYGTTIEDLEKYPVHGNFSYVTVSAPEVVWAYAEAFHMEDHPERILPIGISRTDLFFSRKYRENARGKAAWVLRRMAPALFLKEKDNPAVRGEASGNSRDMSAREIYERIGDVYTDRVPDSEQAADPAVVPGKKVILYAPTFRGSAGRASSPDALDIPMMKRALGKDFILLINHHPFVRAKTRPKIPESCRDFAFDMTDHLAIEELLTVADVCITDYSSLIFEYSLFERPMVFFAYDMESYLDERGFYYPVSDMMPGPVCRKTKEIIEVLKRADADFDLARVREFKYRFMSGCDGHATARVLKLMGVQR